MRARMCVRAYICIALIASAYLEPDLSYSAHNHSEENGVEREKSTSAYLAIKTRDELAKTAANGDLSRAIAL